MKTTVLILPVFLCPFFLPAQGFEPFVYFKQDFCEPDLQFQHPAPGIGQVDHVITTSSAGVLKGDCYLDASRTEPTGGGSVRIIRTSSLTSPAPRTLHARIELEVRDITQEGTIAGYFAVGHELISTHTLIPNASLFSKVSVDFRPDGAYNLRVSGSSGALLSNPLNGRITLTWAMNNSPDPFTYLSPLNTFVQLAPAQYDLWINDDHWINGGSRISDVDLDNFAFILSNGVGTVRLHHVEISSNGFQLPLILTHFKAERRLYEALIHWEMAEGHTASLFTVERSRNGENFEPIGTLSVESKAVNRFQFIDASPSTGPNYYRLKMTGDDGEVKYSPIDIVHFDPSEPVLTLAPNPSLPDRITLLAAGVTPESITLFCMSGRPVPFRYDYDKPGMLLSIRPVSPLTSGIYLLRLQQGRSLKTVKVVIP